MHTEEIRARCAALHFRSLLHPSPITLWSAEVLLALADKYTGYRRHTLPEDDPLLGGGFALLDRDFNTIWLSKGRPPLTQSLDAAHEYGHLFMHEIVDKEELFQESAPGYSSSQRDEIDAHVFAAEFLLPLVVVKESFDSGFTVSQIAAQANVPRRLVIQQLMDAYTENDVLTPELTESRVLLDSWQNDAILSSERSLIVGASGTGKTLVVSERCKYLISNRGVHPSKILVIGDSVASAELLRTLLTVYGAAPTAFVPVTTPYQVARDILVRFEKETNTRSRVDGNPEDFPKRALELVRTRPEITESLRGRYRYVLVDNIDRMSEDARMLTTILAGICASPMWATARNFALLSDLGNITRFRLAYQYRYSAKIILLQQAATRTTEKSPVSRRLLDPRCREGSAAIAFAKSRPEAAGWISQYIQQLLHDGYRTSDIVILYNSQTSTGALWKTAQFFGAQASERRQTRSIHVAELFGVLQLALSTWTHEAMLLVGRTKRYDIPLDELLDEQRDWKDFAERKARQSAKWRRLIEDIDQCSIEKSPRDLLERYVLDISHSLPAKQDAASEMASFLSDLPRRLETTMSAWYQTFIGERPNLVNLSVTKSKHRSAQLNILPFGQGAKRTWPVVIVVDPVVARVADILTGAVADSSRDQTFERSAISAAEDHLLFCAVAPNADRMLTSFLGRFAKRESIQILDWLGVPAIDFPMVKERGAGKKIRSDVSAAIYQQCPRRAFYEAVLRRKVTRFTTALEVFNYPGTPADEGLCINCEFDAVCPSEL